MDLKKICATALTLTFAAAAMPAQAAPLPIVNPGSAPTLRIDAQFNQNCPPQGCRPGRPGSNNPGKPGRPGPSNPSWGGPSHGGPNHGGPGRPGHGGPGRPGQGGWNGPGKPGWSGGPSRPGHWQGHQGYRDPRPGYRRGNDGWWYPLAAFGVGALLGGAIANQPQEVAPPHLSSNHLRWCEDRYRSYRASDNSFQPYEGPRQQCRSPYN
nr:BA14K family protein [Kaistia granuli]